MSGLTVLDRHIVITPGLAGGKPHIAGRRITVQNIVIWHEYMGKSPDEISAEHDLTLADVHAALAYYFDHHEEIEQCTREDQALIESLRAEGPSLLRRKLGPAPRG